MVGRRSRGRSPIRWSDQIRLTLNMKLHDVLHNTMEKNTGRKTLLCREVPIIGRFTTLINEEYDARTLGKLNVIWQNYMGFK